MVKGEIKEVLSRIKWDPNFSSGNVEIVIVDRLARSQTSIIQFKDIETVDSASLTCKSGKWIPFHRIIEIRDATTGVVYWRKRLTSRA